ncbi:hypothetical protein TNCV_2131831 [Trichonephila clavipes]|nr:hypothetical protein TNCV_2131831 [Trichonephila clavipes]
MGKGIFPTRLGEDIQVLFSGFWVVSTLLNSTIQLIPEVFCSIQAWTLGMPVQLDHLIIILLIHGGPRNVTRGIVILEVAMIHPVKLQNVGGTFLSRIVLKESALRAYHELRSRGSQYIPCETSPDHYSLSPKLYCRRNAFWKKTFSR